jgi:APA family basic amino acid/polyamine antiporter
MSIVTLFVTSNTVLIMLVVGSRMIYGIMAKEGAFPSLLSRINPNKKTPSYAIIVTMIFNIIPFARGP